jgi:anti-anti-sigma factor
MKRGSINFLIVKQKRRNVYVSFDNIQKLNLFISGDIKLNLYNIIKVPRTNLILNLDNIRFIDSTGFKMLNFIARVSRNYSSSFNLANVSDELMELIELYRRFNMLENNISIDKYSMNRQAVA